MKTKTDASPHEIKRVKNAKDGNYVVYSHLFPTSLIADKEQAQAQTQGQQATKHTMKLRTWYAGRRRNDAATLPT